VWQWLARLDSLLVDTSQFEDSGCFLGLNAGWFQEQIRACFKLCLSMNFKQTCKTNSKALKYKTPNKSLKAVLYTEVNMYIKRICLDLYRIRNKVCLCWSY